MCRLAMLLVLCVSVCENLVFHDVGLEQVHLLLQLAETVLQIPANRGQELLHNSL